MKNYEEKVINIMDSAKDNIRTQLDKAYKSGYEDAKSTLVQTLDLAHALAHEESDHAYQQGLDDAWECVREILQMSSYTASKLFGDCLIDHITQEYCVSDVLQIIKEYEEQQTEDTEIKVGDELISKYNADKVVVLRYNSKYDGNEVVVTYTDGSSGKIDKENYEKTGRHFDQIAEVLEKMGSEE